MSDNAKDVNTAETTATDSSTGEQTIQDTVVQGDKQTTDNNSQSETKEVPEVNRWAEKARKAEKEAAQLRAEVEAIKKSQSATADPQSQAVKEQLKNLGFMTQEEIEAREKRLSEDNRVQAELSRLETTFDGKDGRPKFDRQEIIDFALDKQIGDLEAAYWAKHRETLIDWHIKNASNKTKGIKTEASDGSGSAEAGTTDADLKEAAAKGDKKALHTLLKRFAPNS